MTTSVYSIRLENEIRQMMEERWKDQIPNERGAAKMIREDRDAP